MFGMLFTAIGMIVSMVMFVLLAGLLIAHPWVIPFLMLGMWLVIRRYWRKFKRACKGAKFDTAKLYPSGYSPYRGTIAEREHPADRNRSERLEHQFIEPLSIGGISRNHHG